MQRRFKRKPDCISSDKTGISAYLIGLESTPSWKSYRISTVDACFGMVHWFHLLELCNVSRTDNGGESNVLVRISQATQQQIPRKVTEGLFNYR